MFAKLRSEFHNLFSGSHANHRSPQPHCCFFLTRSDSLSRDLIQIFGFVPKLVRCVCLCVPVAGVITGEWLEGLIVTLSLEWLFHHLPCLEPLMSALAHNCSSALLVNRSFGGCTLMTQSSDSHLYDAAELVYLSDGLLTSAPVAQ